jgi:hypothetical protein
LPRAATLTGAISTGSTPGDPSEPPPANSLVRLIVTPELSDGLRRAVVALWLAGAAIAGAIVPLATARQSPSSGVLYAAVAAALLALAIGTARGTRWALRVSLVLLGLQLLGTIGSAWQLAHAAADEKAAELRRLGIDPTFGLTLNLIYSAIAFSLFLWAWRQTSR